MWSKLLRMCIFHVLVLRDVAIDILLLRMLRSRFIPFLVWRMGLGLGLKLLLGWWVALQLLMLYL